MLHPHSTAQGQRRIIQAYGADGEVRQEGRQPQTEHI
jgi:hypothetical protein